MTTTTTTGGALRGASAHPDDMPYAPAFGAGRCELCAQSADVLARVVLEPSTYVERDGKKVRRAARAIYVCSRHPGELAQGGPVVTPNARMVDGTSTRRPQVEALFDDTSLKRGGRR